MRCYDAIGEKTKGRISAAHGSARVKTSNTRLKLMANGAMLAVTLVSLALKKRGMVEIALLLSLPLPIFNRLVFHRWLHLHPFYT